MNKYTLAASAAVMALSLAPAAHATALICPGFSSPAVCSFAQTFGTGAFAASHSSGGFSDSFTFALSSPYLLSITATSTAGAMTFTTANLFTSASVDLGAITFNSLPTVFILGPDTYKLVITGSSTGRATFSGTIDITPVAEPATWAMMMAGIATVGMAMRRRRASRVVLSFN